jgi:16S rRNA processing protein RimM
MTAQRRVILGKVAGVYGVLGWVKLWSFTDPVENLLGYRDLEICEAGHWRRLRLVEGRRHGDGLVGRFDGIADRDEAARLVGRELAVGRAHLPPPAPGEYYWTDLVGLEVVNLDGASLGKVGGMMATGANDVMVVEGDRERLVPFLPGRYVSEVDLAGGRIVVDWDPAF